MPEEDCGNAVGGHLRSAYLLALGSGIRHTRPHTAPYHRQFQLAEYTQKSLAHRVGSAFPAVQRIRSLRKRMIYALNNCEKSSCRLISEGRRIRQLTPSFRFHLTMDTLGVQLSPSHYRAGSGLSPFRFRPCRAHYEGAVSLRKGFVK